MDWPCEAVELERLMAIAEAARVDSDRAAACLRMLEASAMEAGAVTGLSGMPFEAAEARWMRAMERSRQFFRIWHAWYACVRAESEVTAES